jgi:nitroreductase
VPTMDTWDALRSRRNVRRYDGRPIPDSDLTRVLEAARITPSAGNRQYWDFVVVTDRERLERLATVWQGARHVASSAATIALVSPPAKDARDRDILQYDLGQATYGIMLVAADLGIGSGHSAIGDQDAAREILGVPADHTVEWLVALGYPAGRPLTPVESIDRRPFDDVIHREQF